MQDGSKCVYDVLMLQKSRGGHELTWGVRFPAISRSAAPGRGVGPVGGGVMYLFTS